ncbi:hypothetical protein Srufu_019050 [Streptomyces libani subsp. rufus]|nr:hypothetical protein Srufu_019050 [Streptomyces libani subsp. rufus]
MAEQGQTRFPPGAQILVRDEEWLVRTARRTDHDGDRIEAIGVSGSHSCEVGATVMSSR